MDFRTHEARIVAYFDVDCFYAQDEVLRRPHLQDRPVGVTQKFLVVTCNYVARHRGVPKMAPIQEAKQRCPDLVLFNGEDLTPYRASSKRIMAVLGRFGVLERRGLDEAALDITAEVMKRSSMFSSSTCQGFSGHVIGLKDDDKRDDVVSLSAENLNPCSSDYYLMVGSQIVAEIRAAVERETGFRCSSGLATNLEWMYYGFYCTWWQKMLAKLVSSVNKPNKQTCILEHAVPDFLSPLPVRKLPGVGHQTESALKDMGISMVADLQQSTLQQLSNKFGNRVGMLLFNSCRGVDTSVVQDKGPPKSLSVEDSFQPCRSFQQAEEILQVLAPDLISRLDEDKEEHSRRPKVFFVKWRYAGNWAFRSCSAPMPLELLSASVVLEKRLETVVEVAMQLLSHALGRQSFALVVLNIGATSFTPSLSGNDGASHDIRSFLCIPAPSLPTQVMALKVTSKREARANREENEKARSVVKVVLPVSTSSEMDGTWDLQTRALDSLQPEEEDTGEERPDEGDAGKTSCCVAASFEATRGGLSLKGPREVSGTCLQPNPSYVQNRRAVVDRALRDDRLKMVLTTDLVGKEASGLSVNAPINEVRIAEHGREFSSGILEESGFWEDESGLHGMVITASHDHDITICEACGQQLNKKDARAKQEHDDYHYALDLELRERGLEAVSCTDTRPSSSTSTMVKNLKSVNKPALHLKRKRALVERSKSGSGTLDCFVYRSPGG